MGKKLLASPMKNKSSLKKKKKTHTREVDGVHAIYKKALLGRNTFSALFTPKYQILFNMYF